MILSRNIPNNAVTFIRRCTEDVMNGRFAPTPDSYLEYLIAETETSPYRNVLDYIRVLDRQHGKPRFYAEADHIIPRGVWSILMFAFLDRNRAGTSFNVLSNLFWRDPHFNRTNDDLLIRTVRAQADRVRLCSTEGFAWRRKWVEIFLRTKRDEGVLFAGEPVDPLVLDQMEALGGGSNWLNRG